MRYIKWDCDNKIDLQIEGLAKNSFLGIHVDYPDFCDGMYAEERIFQEYNRPSPLYADSSLEIEHFSMTPDILSDKNETVTFTVKTKADPARIESVYVLHPTQPMMPALEYDSEKGIWQGTYNTGNRSGNIFCNTEIMAWIKAKDGGVGPKVTLRVNTRYSGKVQPGTI